MDKRIVLCGANSYVEKYYFNEEFSGLPEEVKKELKVLCVLFTEEVGGVLTLEFTPEGTLTFQVACGDSDYLFDEIESGLKIRQLQTEKRALLEALELYYKIVINSSLGEGEGEGGGPVKGGGKTVEKAEQEQEWN